MSKEEFANIIFNSRKVPEKTITCYYNDWKQSGYDILLFKRLLQTRG